MHATGNWAVRLHYYDAAGNRLSTDIGSSTSTTTTTTGQAVGGGFTAPANAASVRISLSSALTGGTLKMDTVSLLQAPQATKYYFAGAQRVAMRVNDQLSYLVSDHLGSTSLVVKDTITGVRADDVISEMRYEPWGEVRYPSSGGLPLATQYTYTGQYSYMDDPTTGGTTEGFGLMFYNARMYDPVIGRFTSADTIVPGGVQGLDRYAYVNNNSLAFIDPSGHFTSKAIRDYLLDYYQGDRKAANAAFQTWKNDNDWWDMMRNAEAGDVLYGTAETQTTNGGAIITFGFAFGGEGDDYLAGISPVGNAQGAAGITLQNIQEGHGTSVGYDVSLTWMGLYRKSNSPREAFPYTRPGYEPEFVGTPSNAKRNTAWWISIGASYAACAPVVGVIRGLACSIASTSANEHIYDWLDIEEHDYIVNSGPVSFTFQLEAGSSAMWNIEEIVWWSSTSR